MNDVNPIFKQALAALCEPDDSSAVEGGIVIHPIFGPGYEAQEFDEYDDALMESVCEGSSLGKPVQALLLTLREIQTTASSFGMNSEKSKAKAYDDLLPELEALRAACKAIWEDK